MISSTRATRINDFISSMLLISVVIHCASPAEDQGTFNALDVIEPTETTTIDNSDIPKAPDPCLDLPDNVGCDDGDFCTEKDYCKNSVCQPGTPVVCESEDGCQTGTCSPLIGCEFFDLVDGTACTANCFDDATCIAGACVPDEAKPKVCPEPTNPCIVFNACDPATGECTLETKEIEGTACNSDNDLCTLEECNAEGTCEYTGAETCEEQILKNACFSYECTADQGCVQLDFTAGNACDDGDACTYEDICVVEGEEQTCVGNPIVVDDNNECTNDQCVNGEVVNTPAANKPCTPDDGCTENGVCKDGMCIAVGGCECNKNEDCPQPTNPCIGISFCDKTGDAPKCGIIPGTTIECPAPKHPCEVSECDPQTLLCKQSDQSDGTPCDDDNPCTAQTVCIASQCTAGFSVDCDDGVFCNGQEICDKEQGCLMGTPPVTDDGHVCTLDMCDEAAGKVQHLPDHKLCDDGLFCNGVEICDSGKGCISGELPTDDDGVECTDEVCLEETDDIIHVTNNSICDDNNDCNGQDLCDPVLDCITDESKAILPDGVPCDDGNACTTGDKCVLQQCLGQALDCNDSSECTHEVCDSESGCVYTNLTKGWPCNDGNPCTAQGECDSAGTCITSTKVNGAPCVNLSTNQCILVAFCADGACIVEPNCDGNLTGQPCNQGYLDCDDENVCTDDSCDPTQGCIHTPNADPCEDGDLCTLTGQCVEGACVNAPPVDCSAIDTCHNDGVCIAETGTCTQPLKPDNSLCDDGDACTQPDTCSQGNCQGKVYQCNDKNTCTEDSCDPETGCKYKKLPNGQACDDGNGCTIDTTCTNGFCGGGTTIPDTSECDDNNQCTQETSCTFGLCSGGKLLNCDDNNICTADICDQVAGCVHKNLQGPCEVGCWCSMGQCTSGSEGYYTEWKSFWSHSLKSLPEGLPPNPKEGFGQGADYVDGELVWVQTQTPSMLWIDRKNANSDHWASKIEIRRPPHSTVSYTIIGNPGPTKASASSGIILWLYKVETAESPQVIEIHSIRTVAEKVITTVLYSGTVDSTVNEWFAVRSEFETGLNSFNIKVGGKQLGPWPLKADLLKSTHIGLASNALFFPPNVAWKNLSVDDGTLVQFIPESCQSPKCGDGLTNQVLEECDDGNQNNGDGCSASCKEESEVIIAEGPFWMGCDLEFDEGCINDASPSHLVELDEFYIDRYEVSVTDYEQCVVAGICTKPQSGHPHCSWPEYPDRPINCVTWEQAAIYCVWMGKQLPTEAQWEKAARGGCELYPEQNCGQAMPSYPWGNSPPTCKHAVLSGCESGNKAHPIDVGSKPAGASPYGAHDVSGNVAEWVNDWYSPNFYKSSPVNNPIGPPQGTKRAHRGGSYEANVFGNSAAPTTWFRGASELEQQSPMVGFRCSRSTK